MNFSSYQTPYYFIPSGGRPIPLRDDDVTWMGRNGCTPLPQPSSFNHYTVYEKEMIRQAIINHEASFRYQVHELHRLHQRQKELMAEHRMREIAGNQVLYQRSHQHGDTYFQRPSFAGESLQSDNNSFLAKLSRADNQVLPSHINGKRMIDLELPAHLYMQSDEEDNSIMLPSIAKETREPNLESFQHNPFDTTGSLNIHSSCGGTKLGFDLNEPIQLDDESYSSCHLNSTSWSSQTVLLSPAPSREPVNESKASIEDNVVDVISAEEKKVEHQPLNSEAGSDEVILAHKSSAEGTSLGSNISCESHDSPKTVGSCISCSPQLVPHPADSDLKAISSVTSKKRSLNDSREVPLAVQALPCFKTTKVKKKKSANNADRRLPKRMKNSHVDLNCMPLDLETEDYQAPHSSDFTMFSSFDDNEESEDTFEVALYLPKEDKTGVGELDKIAAEAICSMSSSQGITTPKPSRLLDNCLNWFAGIASSVSEDRVLKTRKARVRRTKDTSFCKGKKQNEQKARIVKETSLNTIEMGRKTDVVAFDNIKRRKRNTGNSFSKRKNVGNCLHGWGLRTCRRKARRARRVFDDFLHYFSLYYF